MYKTTLCICLALCLLLAGCGQTGTTSDDPSAAETTTASLTGGNATADPTGETTTTTYETFEDGTPNTLPPGIITDVDPDTVTEDEKADEVQQFRAALAALAKNTDIDRLEISQTYDSFTWDIKAFTRREQIDEWIDIFRDASLTAEPRSQIWGVLPVFLTFYEGDTELFGIRLMHSCITTDSERVMLALDSTDISRLEQQLTALGFLY